MVDVGGDGTTLVGTLWKGKGKVVGTDGVGGSSRKVEGSVWHGLGGVGVAVAAMSEAVGRPGGGLEEVACGGRGNWGGRMATVSPVRATVVGGSVMRRW